jgi:hypothetical protein
MRTSTSSRGSSLQSLTQVTAAMSALGLQDEKELFKEAADPAESRGRVTVAGVGLRGWLLCAVGLACGAIVAAPASRRTTIARGC